jgi:hypothetical protein
MKEERKRMKLMRYSLCLLLISLSATTMAASPALPSPAQLYERAQKEILPPFAYEITSDKIVVSDIYPAVKLRRIEFSFVSQINFGEKVWHRGVILIPTDKKYTNDPERRGKVVIVAGNVVLREACVVNYAMPIATKLGYPTMLLPVPGEGENNPGRGYNCRPLIKYSGKTRDAVDHYFFRMGCIYMRGVDVFAKVLEIDKSDLQVIVGGHSKAAAGAYIAAAISPDTFTGVVFMGYEGVTKPETVSPFNAIRPRYTQKYVKCPTIYVGSSNEGGYAMFNINKRQAFMKNPWTITMIPNYKHATENEKQFIAWQLWVSHIFDDRPIAKISDLKHTETDKRTIFQARIDCPNKKLLTLVWYTYCDDEPYWRDLMWYPATLRRKEGNLYEARLQGKMPDAWMVEVLDVSQGIRGYVTSLPMKLGDKEVKERKPRNGLPRLWEPTK